jgi:hypothetical protein
MKFRKQSNVSAPSMPMYPNPPQFGSRSDMPAYKPMERRSGSDMPTESEQRQEQQKARELKYPGTSEAYSKSLYRPGGNPPRSGGGSTLDRPARDYQ